MNNLLNTTLYKQLNEVKTNMPNATANIVEIINETTETIVTIILQCVTLIFSAIITIYYIYRKCIKTAVDITENLADNIDNTYVKDCEENCAKYNEITAISSKQANETVANKQNNGLQTLQETNEITAISSKQTNETSVIEANTDDCEILAKSPNIKERSVAIVNSSMKQCKSSQKIPEKSTHNKCPLPPLPLKQHMQTTTIAGKQTTTIVGKQTTTIAGKQDLQDLQTTTPVQAQQIKRSASQNVILKQSEIHYKTRASSYQSRYNKITLTKLTFKTIKLPNGKHEISCIASC